jgi:GTP-binding protein EngB required for normal cell division
MEPHDDLSEKILECLNDFEYFDKQLKSFRRFQNYSNAVVILGQSGSGKSTICNYLMGEALEIYKMSTYYCLKAYSDNEIGHRIGSLTNKPNLKLNTEGTLFIDCPGFGDTRECPQDIKNAYYINRIIKELKNVTIVLVISEHDLRGKALNLRNVLENVSLIFENSIDKFLNSFCIIYSQITTLHIDDTLAALEEENSSSININIVRYIRRNIQTKVAEFPCASIYKNNSIYPEEFRKNILQIIRNTSPNCFDKINIILSSRSKYILRNFEIEYINTLFSEEFISEIIKRFSIQHDKILNELVSNNNDYKKIIDTIKNYSENFVRLFEFNSLQELITNLMKFDEIYKMEALKEKKYIFEFLKIIHEDECFRANIEGYFLRIKQRIDTKLEIYLYIRIDEVSTKSKSGYSQEVRTISIPYLNDLEKNCIFNQTIEKNQSKVSIHNEINECIDPKKLEESSKENEKKIKKPGLFDFSKTIILKSFNGLVSVVKSTVSTTVTIVNIVGKAISAACDSATTEINKSLQKENNK